MRVPASCITMPQARLVCNVLAGPMECIVLLSNLCWEIQDVFSSV